MSRVLGCVVGILGAAILLLTSPATSSQQSSAKFEPADVQGAGDIPYPPNTTTTGLISLLVDVNDAGRVQKIHVMRDTPPLTAVAQSSVQSWDFKAGQSDGRSVASQLPVSVVFNPFNPGGTEITGFTITDEAASAVSSSSSFAPAKIATAAYALFPPNSLAQGTVVLSVTLDKAGQVQKVRIAKDVAALSPAAVDAVKSWKYQPAKWKGQPVPSKLIVAFVFQRNLS